MSWREVYRNRRVLLLGATGFIGRRVARDLLSLGAELHAAVRSSTDTPSLEGSAAQLAADLERPGAAAALVERVRPALTFNLAGYGVDPRELDPAIAARINHDLVAELAHSVARHADPDWQRQQLVHAGSAAEYGAARGNLAEVSEPLPQSLYGRTKLAGTEELARASRAGALRGVTARLFTVYGPGERAGRLLPSLVAARDSGGGEAIPLTPGTQRRDFTYLGDVAEGLLRLGALTANGLGAVNLATGRLESVRSFVERAAGVLGIPRERLRFGALPLRRDEMEHEAVNVGLLRSLCGWTPETTIEAGVRRTLTEG